MRATLRTINLVEVLEGELKPGRQGLDPRTKFALLQGRKLVEEGLDNGRIDYNHRELED